MMMILSLFLLFSLFPLAAQDDAAFAGAPEIVSRAAVVMDAGTGTVLYSKNPDDEIPPASLTKLMTMHLAFREAAARGLSFDAPVEIAREAWAVNQPPRSSLMFLGPGQTVSLRELLLGLAVCSGNDAAVAVALRFAPSIKNFAGMMNDEARRLGLAVTRFVEPSGISELNMTTAGEFAVFARDYLALHPQALKDYHSVPEFAYPKAENVGEAFRDKPGTIVQHNRNGLLGVYPGVDGMKTGYIDEAGYNIALTASRSGTRFIAVILGAPAQYGGDRIRDRDGRALLDWAFANFKTLRPPAPEQIPRARLWKGQETYADLKYTEALPFTVPVDRGDNLSYTVELDDPLVAPLPRGFIAGNLIISDDKGELRRIPLLTVQDYDEGGFFRRLWDSVRLFFRRLSRHQGGYGNDGVTGLREGV